VSFGPPSALRQKLHIDNMLLLARLEGKPKSGAIFVYLFISATLAGQVGQIGQAGFSGLIGFLRYPISDRHR